MPCLLLLLLRLLRPETGARSLSGQCAEGAWSGRAASSEMGTVNWVIRLLLSAAAGLAVPAGQMARVSCLHQQHQQQGERSRWRGGVGGVEREEPSST